VDVHLVSPWNTEASQPQLPRFRPDGQPPERPHLRRALQARATQRAADLAPTIKGLQAAGKTSLSAIANAMNEQGIHTARGSGRWSAVQSHACWSGWTDPSAATALGRTDEARSGFFADEFLGAAALLATEGDEARLVVGSFDGLKDHDLAAA
jgi:hypothetical protein